jgi:hypothetical protein
MLMLDFVNISKRQGGNDMSKALRGITIALDVAWETVQDYYGK